MQAVKAVRQSYQPTDEVMSLLEDFRRIVNDCIRIGLREGVTSLKSLSLRAYRQLKDYRVPSCYKLTAISMATSIIRNYRKAIRRNPKAAMPYAKRLMLVDCYGFRVKEGRLRLPLGDRRYACIPLSKHTQEVLSGHTVRSVTLTACTLSISFSKETAEIEPVGCVGIDRNLDNVTIATSNGGIERFDLSKATLIKARYREVKSHFKRNDARMRRRIYGKYGVKQTNKVKQILHHVSKSIVQ